MKEPNYKELVPVLQCEFEEKDGLVTVLYKKEQTKIEKVFFRWMKDKPYRIDLDETGTFIWKKINGVLKVSEIIDITKEHFGDKVEPAEERVVIFMKQMYHTKLIMLYEKVVEKE
ncbi:MAG: PqqD family protein [Chlorobi bacterium]|nr:PqqD family protein [Chlorobiota bacterium]